ncbi:MAG: CHAP domain-containing protein [Acetobacteraceae bacterium]|nr:CHAP domain-containing protein [Pseudomonadota bacterium]
MHRALCYVLLTLCLALAACGSNRAAPSGGAYVGGNVPIECAPFARALTGVKLSGAAADWWPQAAGRYDRSRDPDVGSVLVFRRGGRLPSGHVAVVSEVVGPRQIRVTQANWVRHRITEEQSVIDVSRSGDWSLVRVFWPPSGEMGTTEYPTYGFIRPDHPPSKRMIAQRTPDAVKMALAGW